MGSRKLNTVSYFSFFALKRMFIFMLFEMISLFPTLFPVSTFYSLVEEFISLSFLSQIQLAWKAEVVSSRSF